MYRRSLAADEVFMQTLLMNSDYRDRCSTHGHVRLIDWKNREGNSPKTFTMRNSEELRRAVCNPDKLFIRKIQESRDPDVAAYICRLVADGVTAPWF